MARASEDDLIATYFSPLAGQGSLALKDDAALLVEKPGFDTVLTCDALVAGVHFFADDPPDAIAAKALRVNLSDLAAKGATPAGFLVALALPRSDREWLAEFANGLRRDIDDYRFPLLGGDTVATPGPLMVSVTALGHVPAGRMVPRTGARSGDIIYVSGTIGDGALGLLARLGTLDLCADEESLIERYLRPQPRNALASALLEHANAAMDLSDGLIGDLRKMMRVSGGGAQIELARVPLSPAAVAVIGREPSCWMRALTGGDDYEILTAVAPAQATAFEAAALACGVPVARIGVATTDLDVRFRDANGAAVEFERGSFSHF
ncbi:MAG: thiamine-phosphate kinase [Beijerinckiaceae bacterium]|nr:thiamine-phosphate kinase [Beijerinckiaceae bacterium]